MTTIDLPAGNHITLVGGGKGDITIRATAPEKAPEPVTIKFLERNADHVLIRIEGTEIKHWFGVGDTFTITPKMGDV